MTIGLLRYKRLLEACLVIGLTTFTSGCLNPTPPLPPLLKNVSGTGGWWGACPPMTENEAHLKDGAPLALSPELGRRLMQLFPPGTNERRLVENISAQGFKTMGPCQGDNSIRSASFIQKDGGILAFPTLPITAEVFWKVDQESNVVWTKGFVRFTGL